MRGSNTNWNLYRSFLAVYDTKSYTLAADIVGITRSAVGQNIKELQKQLNTLLFHSSKLGVEPTSDAIAVYPKIRGLVEALIETEESIQKFDEKSHAVVRLAFPSSFVNTRCMDYFQQFCNKYPNVRLELYEKDGMALLEKKQIDLVMRFDYYLKGSDVERIPLFKQELKFLVTKSFLEERGLGNKISRAQLAELPLIIRRDFIGEFERVVGFAIKPKIITATNATTYSMAERGLGVGCYFYFKGDKVLKSDEVVAIEVIGIEVSRLNCIAFNKSHLTKAAEVFLNGFVEFCKRM